MKKDNNRLEEQFKKIMSKAADLGLDTTKIIASIGFDATKISGKMLLKLIGAITKELIKTPKKAFEFAKFLKKNGLKKNRKNDDDDEKVA